MFSRSKYLLADHLGLEDILNKIYFEGYTYDDIKEYIIPALRTVESVNDFFDTLFNCIKNYSEKVKYYLLNDLKYLINENTPEIFLGNS
jgi:hypothetical protein